MTYEEALIEVRRAMSRNGAQMNIEQVSSATAMAQDARIDGIDVWEFAKDLEKTFGEVVWTIPWGRFSDQRASFYGCSVAWAPFWLLWRLITWPVHGEFVPPPNGGKERLTADHLARVLSDGAWFESAGNES